ncbi:MAG TPA: POTRA domain-containing protein, partial [Pirellulales bacterium]
KGFNFAQIAVLEGNTPGDRRAVLQIHEGPRQRIEHVDFIGNTIVSDERLRTLLKSKAIYGWRVGASFWPYKFGGDFTPEKIDEDLERLSSYYHGLGFWSVRIGREVEYDEDGDSILVTFVIDEGPQFKVRDLTIVGNQKHSTEELVGLMKLKVGEYFNQEKLQADVNNIKNLYGGEGHIHADIQPDVRFLEEPGLLDIVYQIDEGARFRVGKINVVINGDYPHTKITTVLNRVSLHPGDVLDINELRASERRLKGSGLFRNDPAKGTAPKIVFGPPKINGPGGGRTQLAEGPNGSARGQSPETGDGWHYDQRGGVWTTPAASQPQPGDRLIDVTMLDGEILPPVLQDTPTSELRYDVPPGEQAPPVDAPVANPYPGPAFAPPTGYAPRPASSGPIPLGAPGYGHPYPAQAPYPTAPGNPPPHPHPSYGPRPTATQPTGGDSGANAPAAGPTRQMGYRRPLDEANGSPVALSANHSRSVENLDSDDDRPLLHGAGEMLGVRSGQFDDFALASAAFGRHDRQAVLSPGVLNWADVNDPYDLTARDRAIAARPIPAGKVVRGQDGGRAIPNAPWG